MSKMIEGKMIDKRIEGSHTAGDARFGIVAGRFNEPITKRLLSGALEALEQHGVNLDDVTVAWCPGAVEIPLVAQTMAETGSFDAVVCLGAVIRGATPHFEMVCSAASRGTTDVALATGIPILFGVLTTDTPEQAFERSAPGTGNKGAAAAVAAIEMVHLLREIKA